MLESVVLICGHCQGLLLHLRITFENPLWWTLISVALIFDGAEDPISIVKLPIPREWHEEILNELRYMNITAATLFPGLEGFARSLRLHL